MHQSSYNIITRFRDLVDKHFQNEKIRVLDVGSYGVNGTYKEIFAETKKYDYVGLDVNPGPNVDYIPADPYAWPELPDESFDVIISGQAFEHIEFPWLVIDEMRRTLKRNGLICIVAPSRGPEHKYPVDCWRYYPDGFRALAKWAGLEVLESKTFWGSSGFSDGSDQWGDSFCILYKKESGTAGHRAPRTVPATSARSFNRFNPLERSRQEEYYGHAREDVAASLVKHGLHPKRVLEIGCAAGATGKRLRELLQIERYVGVELSEQAAMKAREHLDQVFVADIEGTDLTSLGLRHGDFDLLLALDVLEHLYDPWSTLMLLTQYVRPGGYIVASVPNVQNIAVVDDLLKGRWQYATAGILDATHLRFFTLESILHLFSGAGLSLERTDSVLFPGTDTAKLKESGNVIQQNNVTLSALSRNDVIRFFTYQFVVIGKKGDGPHVMTSEVGSEMDRLMSMSDVYTLGVQSGTPVFSAENTPRLPVFTRSITKGMTSIVILTFNQHEYTKKCIQSIRKHTPEPHEIVFIDNGSTDGTVKWLNKMAAENENYSVIENSDNLGFARGCNQGIEASGGEFILLLNNDVVVSDGWLSGMLECHRHAPDAGIVGPMTNNISGPQRVSSEDYRSIEYLDEYAKKFRDKHRHRRIPLRRIVGFCMLFTRELVEKTGLLDETFGTGNFEDDDLCLRAALEGFRNYIAGDVFIHHFGSRSFLGNKLDYGGIMSGNRKLIEKKWMLGAQTRLGKKFAALKALEKADELHQRGLTDKAVEALVDCIKISPDHKKIYYELSRILMEAKRFAEAAEVFDAMPEWAKDERDGLGCAGYAKEGLGLDEEAGIYAERMLGLHDNDASALNLAGVLAYKRGDREKAGEFFRRAVDSDPGYGEAHTNLGVLQWSSDDRDQAIHNLTRGFVLAPTVPDHSTLFYSALSALGRYSDAEVAFRDARGLYPHNKTIAFLSIDALIQQQKYPLAMVEIEDALVTFGLDDGILAAAVSVREKLGPLSIAADRSKKPSLSLCMIVKNEEDYLAHCLRSVRQVVDEMVVVDTGSTDRTKQIAEVFGAKVHDFVWTGDFSEARNYSLAKAAGDWILILDADEVLSPLDFQELTGLLNNKTLPIAAYTIVTRNYVNDVRAMGWTANDGTYPEESGTGWFPSPKVRLFTRDDRVRFADPVHETLEASLTSAGIPVRPCGVVVHHYGKLNQERENVKGEHYYDLGKQKLAEDPDNLKYLHELATQAQHLDRYDEAAGLWKKLIRSTQDKPVADFYFNLGYVEMMLEQYGPAAEASRRALNLDPGLKEAALNLANCALIMGNTDEASRVIQDILAGTPGYPPALLLLAALHIMKGEFEAAKEVIALLAAQHFNSIPALQRISAQMTSYGQKEGASAFRNALAQLGLITIE